MILWLSRSVRGDVHFSKLSIRCAAIKLTTPGGTNAANTLFTYVVASPPTLTSVSPNTGTTAGTGYGINPGYGSFVGSELDIIGTYNITPYASAQVGYGHFFVGDYVKSSFSSPAVGSRDADYVYLQMTLNLLQVSRITYTLFNANRVRSKKILINSIWSIASMGFNII